MSGGEPSLEEIIEQEQAFRDAEAGLYDRRSDRLGWELSVLDACYERILGLEPGQVAADIGCGTGRHLPWLLERAGQVVGVDHSPRSLEVARERVGPANAGRLRLEAGDIRELPLDDGSVDYALCSETIQHLPSEEYRTAAAREMLRILKPGGVAAVSTYRWFGRVKTLRREGFWESEHGRLYYHLLTAGELRRLLRDAGFEDARVIRPVALPGLAKRMGAGIETQRRLAFMPAANLLGHFLIGYGTKPGT